MGDRRIQKSEIMRLLAPLLLIFTALAACTPTDDLPTEEPTPTLRPSATHTPSPTRTPSPTLVPSPTPLVIAGELAFASDRSGSFQIYLINADGTGLLQLTDSIGDNTSPAWFDDGSGLAFVSTRDGNREIYLMRSDGTDQFNYSDRPGEDHSPAWAPDGTALAFVANFDGFDQLTVLEGGRGLRASLRLEIDDSQQQLCCVTWGSESLIGFTRIEDGIGTIADWDFRSGNIYMRRTPEEALIHECCQVSTLNGEATLMVSAESGVEQIYWWEGREAERTKLTDHPLGSFGPSWSLDGQWVAYHADIGGNFEVLLIQPGQEQPVNLTNVPGNDIDPAWRPLP
ncbi:MAG: hypothetical protein ACC700_15750 [Anaerolineales bacterium]